MKKGFKYRIYPTEEQKKAIAVNFAANRWFWNYALDKHERIYKESGKSISAKYEISKELPSLKKTEGTSWLKSADSMPLIYTADSLDGAFKKFFKKEGGYPNFKRAGYSDSYTIEIPVKYRDKVIDWKNGFVKIGKVGNVATVLHRKFNGIPKAITVSKKSFDYYEISILVDDGVDSPAKQDTTLNGTIGIDMGIKHDSNITISDGTKYPCITTGKYKRRIKRLQKRLSKKTWEKTGKKKYSYKHQKEIEVKTPSRNYLKTKDKLARLEDKVARMRGYNTHLITSELSKRKDIDTICVEDLCITGMVKNHHIADGVSNANMGELTRQLAYKCDWNGKNLVKVGRFYPSSQTCSSCGYINKDIKNLSIRKWVCPVCGETHDRDVNAAKNIRKEGYRTITEGKQ